HLAVRELDFFTRREVEDPEIRVLLLEVSLVVGELRSIPRENRTAVQRARSDGIQTLALAVEQRQRARVLLEVAGVVDRPARFRFVAQRGRTLSRDGRSPDDRDDGRDGFAEGVHYVSLACVAGCERASAVLRTGGHHFAVRQCDD